MSKSKKSLDQVIREEHLEFAEAIDAASVADMDNRLAELAKNHEQVLEAKDADDGLAAAREEANNLAAPYNDSLKLIRLKSKYIVKIQKERS